MALVKAEDQSFDNPALTGSGTNLPEGGKGPNLPDPTEVRGVFVKDGPTTGRVHADGTVTEAVPASDTQTGGTQEDVKTTDSKPTARKTSTSTSSK